MARKLSSDQKGEATVIALRLPPSLLHALETVQAQQEALLTVKTSLSTSAMARALLEEALRARGMLSARPATEPARKAKAIPATKAKGKARVRSKSRG